VPTLATSASCTVSVTFTPYQRSARVRCDHLRRRCCWFTSSRHAHRHRGQCACPTGEHQPCKPDVYFPDGLATTSGAQVLTLTNTGKCYIKTSRQSWRVVTNARTTTCGTTLAAAANCTVSSPSVPQRLGTRTGAIAFTDDRFRLASVYSADRHRHRSHCSHCFPRSYVAYLFLADGRHD